MSDRLPAEQFVGRRAELVVLEQAIGDARQGVPSIVLVSGDAGIGKTTIVTEAASRAGVRLLLGRSTHIGGETIPLAPLADLLRQLRRSSPDLLTDVPGLAPLRDWLRPGTAAPEPSGPRQAGLFVALLELITHLDGDAAVVVGFEDLHWADAVTWDLFEYLGRNVIDEKVVLVGTYRANEVSAHPSQRRRLAELTRLAAAHRIHLQGLNSDEVAEGVTALLGKQPPQALIDQVIARGQGNPFFTRELVAAHLAGETIPLVLSDLISDEIAGLDDAARRVLGVVATIGRETSHQFLEAILEMPAIELEAALRTVIDARLLVVDSDTDAYRFRHALLSEVVYADLLPPQRSRLHRRIAEVLEGQAADVFRRADKAGELAFHLDRSGDSQGAFVALLAAADAAEAVAPAAALGHLERALQLWEVAGDRSATANRGDRLWQAADIATSTVGNDRAVELARAALEIGPPPLGAASGHERLGRYLWASGQLVESQAEFELAARLLTGDEGAEAAPVFAGLGQAELMSGNYSAADRWCAKVFNVVRTPTESLRAWAMAHRVLGVVRSSQGDAEAAVEMCRESVAAANGAQGRAFANVYLCVALLDAGDYQTAVNTALDAVAEALLTGLHGFDCYLDSLGAEALIRLGRWSEAAAVLARQPIANTFPAGLLRFARASSMLAARLGDSDRAIALLADAHRQPVDGWHQSVLDATTADVHLVLCNWEEAGEAAERGWDSSSQTSLLWAARFAMFSAGSRVERSLDARARREVADSADVIADLQSRIDAVRASAERGGHASHRDIAAHLAQAAAELTRLTVSNADAWAEAAARWQDLGDRWATGRALLREAEAAAQGNSADRAASALQKAHSIASDLGAEPLLAEIDAVSRRTRISVQAPTRVAVDEDSVRRLGLTPREVEVLTLLAAGRTNRQIGDELFVSDKT